MPVKNVTPVYTKANILTGMAKLYLAPQTAGAPATHPALTVMINTDWGDPWVTPGATTEGLTFHFERATDTINIEEQLPAVDYVATGATIQVATTLSEDTLDNMVWTYGGGTITTHAATSTLPAYDELHLTDDMETISLGFEGINPAGFFRRVFLDDVQSTAAVETPYRRAAGQRVYPVTFTYTGAISDIDIQDMTAVHSA